MPPKEPVPRRMTGIMKISGGVNTMTGVVLKINS